MRDPRNAAGGHARRDGSRGLARALRRAPALRRVLELRRALDLGRPTGVLWTVAFSGSQVRRMQGCSAPVMSPPPTVQMPARRPRLTRFSISGSGDPELRAQLASL